MTIEAITLIVIFPLIYEHRRMIADVNAHMTGASQKPDIATCHLLSWCRFWALLRYCGDSGSPAREYGRIFLKFFSYIMGKN